MRALESKSIIILTGAGISAESGIRTFRDPGGLWEGLRPEEIAHPHAFEATPKIVHAFYNAKRKQLQEASVAPNAAHLALAQLEKAWRGDFLLVTQNVDNLHERGGSKKLLHMHGELLKVRCVHCDRSFEHAGDLSVADHCPTCLEVGTLRPDIVWFSEMPMHLETIYGALKKCDFFIAIGTSGNVYPAAGFVSHAPRECMTIELNFDDTPISRNFSKHIRGKASIEVPRLTRDLLQELG
jgi:NAD-dependent deacetylase